MIPCKTIASRALLVFFLVIGFSINKVSAQDAKAVFNTRCASCHALDKKVIGPALRGVESRWPDKNKLKQWIVNNVALTQSGDIKAGEVSQIDPSVMPVFTDLSDAEVEAIIAYTNEPPPTPGPTPGAATEPAGNRNAIFFGIISLIMAIIALILMQVNSNLKKMSDDVEGYVRPEPVPFYKNKVYIALLSIVLFIVGGYYVTKGAIGLGRQKDYQPIQPIFYSHKVHAGINQISCLFCHGNSMDSRHAAIPSTNVCMNCHKAITTYEKGPQLVDGNGNQVNGTAEIAKLYKYAGFDPNNATAWNPSMAKPIPWVKIHNLPDHVYFNHAQHVTVGNVQCQTCHGEITAMDEVYQFSELSMGWCINCHRGTKVNFYDKGKGTGNKFYSIYEKFHNDIKSGKMDSVTVQDIGGLECQKCHY